MSKKQACEICLRTDCPGWDDGDPFHEYQGKGKWFLGCHCEGCRRARNESGGFIGALADHLTTDNPPPPAKKLVGWHAEEKLTVGEAWTILCETPDITSPEEYPDHALITMEQLGSFMARAIAPQCIPADQAPRGSYGLIRHRSGLIDVVYKTNNGEPFLETWRYAGTARGGEQAPWPDAFMPLDRGASAEVEG